MSKKMTKKEIAEWMEKLHDGVMFLIGIELRKQRMEMMLKICRHYNGNIKQFPPLEKGFKRRSGFCSRMFIDELLKTQADLALQDAPDWVIDAIAFEDGCLYKPLREKFVEAYFRVNYAEIYKFIANWDEVQKILSLAGNQDVVNINGLMTNVAVGKDE